MTFQVALIGSEGIVVGSDQLVNRQSNNENENPTIEISRQEKFVKSDDDSLICFFSGGPTCRNVASTIALHCTDTSMPSLRWETAVRTRVNNSQRLPEPRLGDVIIVVQKRITNSIWLVQRPLEGPTDIYLYKDQICTGNNALAKFLVTHLWNYSLTLPQLKKLALLALSYAAKENPGAIGAPFDLMTLDNNHNIEWSHYESLDTIFSSFDGKLKEAFNSQIDM